MTLDDAEAACDDANDYLASADPVAMAADSPSVIQVNRIAQKAATLAATADALNTAVQAAHG